MKNPIYSTELIFNLNERLFLNSLAGVTDEQAAERISGHNNPFIWIATHTVWARFNTAAIAGKPAQNPYQGQFENFKPMDSTMVFPTIDELRAEWNNATALLKEALANITEEHLAGDAPFKNPTGDFTIAGTIIFLAQHESYDIGQMAYLKKFLTKEAMSYN